MARLIQSVHPPTFTTHMEQLQVGYVEAVAATAGCTFNVQTRDTFGIDALITKHRTGIDEDQLMVQLKNTTKVGPSSPPGTFTFSFKNQDQIDRLRNSRRSVPRILIVMISPKIQTDWTTTDHDQLVLRHCCYWKNVAAAPLNETKSSLSVLIDRQNLFDADALNAIMDRVRRDEVI